MYGEVLQARDLPIGSLFLVLLIWFSFGARFNWISQSQLCAFLLLKFGLGIGFSVDAIIADREFDSAGAYAAGLHYAAMFQALVQGTSTEYLSATPFYGLAGNSTDRLMSLTGFLLSLAGESFIGATALAGTAGATGQLLLYRYFRERFPDIRPLYFTPVLFHPSLMLWSGMLLKDSFGILALGGAVYSLHRWIGGRGLGAIPGLVISIYSMMLFRAFIMLPLAAFALFMMWDRVIVPFAGKQAQGGKVKALYLFGASSACALVFWGLIDRFGTDLIDRRQESAAVFAQIEAGSTFENVELSLSPQAIIALGGGAINSLFRPFPWDVRNPTQAAAAAENLAMLVFVGAGFYCYFRKLNAVQRNRFSGVFWGMLAMALIIAAGVGLFSSNSGTISRYRTPMVPFLVAVPGLAFGMADKFRRARERLWFPRSGARLAPRPKTPRLT